jgi:hypothetical protein
MTFAPPACARRITSGMRPVVPSLEISLSTIVLQYPQAQPKIRSLPPPFSTTQSQSP